MPASRNRPLLGGLTLALVLAAGAAPAQSTSTTTSTTTTRTTITPAGTGTTTTTDARPGMSMPMPTATPMAGGRMVASPADRTFMTMANQGNMTEVAASRLAMSRGTSDDVKMFAEMMVADHTLANQKLMPVAQAHGVALPTALDARHKADVAATSRRRNGAAFDRAYVDMMVRDHVQTVRMFEAAAANPATAPDVRQYAEEQLPTLRGHLTRIQEIQASMQA